MWWTVASVSWASSAGWSGWSGPSRPCTRARGGAFTFRCRSDPSDAIRVRSVASTSSIGSCIGGWAAGLEQRLQGVHHLAGATRAWMALRVNPIVCSWLAVTRPCWRAARRGRRPSPPRGRHLLSSGCAIAPTLEAWADAAREWDAVCHKPAQEPRTALRRRERAELGRRERSVLCTRATEDAAMRRSPPPQATSRSFCASASDCSFFSDWFSIWRMRSRVTLNVRPTSSRVRGCSPPSP